MVPGERLGGRFEIEERVGSGGMAFVFRARDFEAGGHVAVKTMRNTADDAASLGLDTARFLREARILASISHPAVVRHVADGLSTGGEPYLAMEWLEGESLSERLERSPLTLLESVELARRTADALAAMHDQGIVHRDIKPGNLFLTDREVGGLKVLDFGISRPASSTIALTGTGVMLGTPSYMAPEQARCEAHIDCRADIYSLGCVLFRCLTGQPPFHAQHAFGVLTKVLLEPVPRASSLRPDLPPELVALVDAMLSKEPADRPASAASVASELGKLIGALDADAAASGPRPERSRPYVLTGREQRMVGALVVRAPDERATPRPSRDADTAAELQGAGEETRLWRRVESIAYDHGGHAFQPSAAAWVITFVGSTVATDLAVRAARCALALRAVLPGSPMLLTVLRSEMDGMRLVGHAVDRLLRSLRSIADAPGPANIVADAVSAALIASRFDLKADAHGFVLTSTNDAPLAAMRLLGSPTPLVGRSWELRSLKALLATCIEDLSAHAMLMIAPAGLGKSRLALEFVQSARKAAPDLKVWIARGEARRSGSPLQMLAHVVRSACHIEGGAPLDEQRRQLRACVARRCRDDGSGPSVEFLGELAGIPFDDAGHDALRAARQDGRLMNEQLRRAWGELLDVETAAHPLLLVLDDLQWGDLSTLKFVDWALSHLERRPWMVLALARPEIADVFPDLWDTRNVHRLHMQRLTTKAAEELAHFAGGGALSQERVAHLAAQSDGNPFVLEELIRAEVEQPLARRSDGTDPIGALALVQARYLPLAAEARRCLRAASLFGDVFWAGAVSTLAYGQARSVTVDRCLEELLDKEILIARPRSRFPGETEFAFRHALLREGAYAMLTDADREQGHRAAGTWLEQHGEADAVMLAQHFERGGDIVSAVGHYLRAADGALRSDDQGGAVAYAERAAQLGAAGAELGESLRVRAEVHLWRGELSLAAERGSEAVALSLRGSAPWFRTLHLAATARGKLGDLDGVEHLGSAVLACAPAEGTWRAQVTCLSVCAIFLMFGGRYPAADRLLAAAGVLHGGHAARDDATAPDLYEALAIRALLAGDISTSLERFTAALEVHVRADDRRKACAVRANLGFLFSELGAHARAQEILRQALGEAESLGLLESAMHIRQNLSRALACCGEIGEARRLIARAIDGLAEQGNQRLTGAARAYAAQIELFAGDAAAAEEQARLAADVLAGAPPLRAVALALRARSLLRLRRAVEALGPAREALSTLEALGEIEEGESLVRLVYAEAHLAVGELGEFKRAARAARDHLVTRAGKITNAEWRTRFLTMVPDNVATLELAARLGGPSSVDA